MTYIGIDPGASGGIAVICNSEGSTLDTYTLPKDERQLFDLIDRLTGPVIPKICIERIPTAIFGADKSSGAKLYGSYMSLRMALVSCGFIVGDGFFSVSSHQWQKALGIPKRRKEESRTQWKHRLRSKALELFPWRKISLEVSDAVLIAEHCRRTYAIT